MKLLIENWRQYLSEASVGFDLAKSIAYTAFVLDDSAHQKLSQMAPKGWKVYAHHMTMLPPTEQKQRLPPTQFFEGCVKVVGIARNEMVIAVKVDLGEMVVYNKIRGIPHITIATAVDPKKTKVPDEPKYYSPELSNDFSDEDFEPIKPIKVCGKVEEIPR